MGKRYLSMVFYRQPGFAAMKKIVITRRENGTDYRRTMPHLMMGLLIPPAF
ncbi:MAG: hypothetical protein M0Q92_10945 [Methanoregula sp.]|jgi:hypothetical protein|nr:hypothetical protein [Methanoregula sp.]